MAVMPDLRDECVVGTKIGKRTLTRKCIQAADIPAGAKRVSGYLSALPKAQIVPWAAPSNVGETELRAGASGLGIEFAICILVVRSIDVYVYRAVDSCWLAYASVVAATSWRYSPSSLHPRM